MTKELEEAKAWAEGYLEGSQPMCEACLRTLLSALSRGGGWRLMPTEAMLVALSEGIEGPDWSHDELVSYRAMIAAAPLPAAPHDGGKS